MSLRSIYISGPIRGVDEEEVERNIHTAMEVGNCLIDMGLRPYIPHLSYYLNKKREREHSAWMAVDIYWIRKCDALLRLYGASKGADTEELWAIRLHKQIFTDTTGFGTVDWESLMNEISFAAESPFTED
jgi:hypothetical protein